VLTSGLNLETNWIIDLKVCNPTGMNWYISVWIWIEWFHTDCKILQSEWAYIWEEL